MKKMCEDKKIDACSVLEIKNGIKFLTQMRLNLRRILGMRWKDGEILYRKDRLKSNCRQLCTMKKLSKINNQFKFSKKQEQINSILTFLKRKLKARL